LVLKVIHLIPYDGIGGVEKAAASSEGAGNDRLRLERLFIFENVYDRTGRLETFNPLAVWSAARRLVRKKPDLVVASLWRSLITMGLARLQGCRAPMVLFLHNARDAHWLDRLITRFAVSRAIAVWADSSTTLEERLEFPINAPTRVISYLVAHRKPVRGEYPDPSPNFIFWGRLAKQKDPLRAVRLFAAIHSDFPNASFSMIGPDGGLQAELEAEIDRRGLGGAVKLLGPMNRLEIEQVAAKSSFYLQTSLREGMAMSVVEAMQAGLVPVVAPVGEIKRYTVNGSTALWVDVDPQEETRILNEIRNLIEMPWRWRTMRANALEHWSKQPTYVDNVLAAADELLNRYSIEDSTRNPGSGCI